jgi:hypothetical protein
MRDRSCHSSVAGRPREAYRDRLLLQRRKRERGRREEQTNRFLSFVPSQKLHSESGVIWILGRFL